MQQFAHVHARMAAATDQTTVNVNADGLVLNVNRVFIAPVSLSQ